MLSRLFALMAVSAIAAHAQATSTGGDVVGSVIDASGAPLSAAQLTLLNDERGFSRSTGLREGGSFAFNIVPPGIYRLRVEAAGFTTKAIDGLEVRVGDTITQVIQMTVSTVQSEIVVNAELQVVETERTQQANTIEQRRINNLPINRRNYLDFALLAPGVVETSLVDDANYRPIQTPNSGLSFGGSNGRGNGFFIDGVENYQASGGVRPSVSQEAALEFQINRNSFSAEFGNASGGVINIITKSGTNDVHGNLFGFLRHRSIQARNYFDPAKSAFTRVQAGATLGGALKKDKTFYFLAYELLNRNETNFVPLLQDRSVFTSLTPSQTALFNYLTQPGTPAQILAVAQGVRQALIPANNPRVTQLFASNSGTFPFSETANVFSGRLDHRFSDNHSIFLRSNSTFNPQENSNFGALEGFNRGRRLNVQDTSLALGDTWVINPRLIMETRLMFGYNKLVVEPNDANGPEININGFGFFGRQIFLPYGGIERHYQVLQNFTAIRGKHTFKFGYDINPVRNSQVSETFFGGRFTFSEAIPVGAVFQSAAGNPAITTTIAQYLAQTGQAGLVPALSAPISALQSFANNLPILYQQGFGNPNYIPEVLRLGFYAQDTWRINRALTLNYGLRYENERHNPIVPRDNNNIGPRFGFAWSPSKSGKTAIRGGYGLYFSQINAQIAGVADPLSGAFINQALATIQGSVFPQPGTATTWSSAGIYQALLRQGVIGSRAITPADLRGLGINVGPGLPGAVLFGVDKDFENPWAHQASFEVEQGFGPWAVSVGYNFNRAAHLARILGRNVRYTGQRLPDGRPTFTRIDPTILQLNIFESSANSFYHAGMVQVTRRFQKNLAVNSNFTFSRAIDESVDFNSDYSPNDQLNARAERSLSAFHQKFRLVLNAVYQTQSSLALFHNWNIAPIVQWSSWRPFNLLTGVDVQGDTYTTNKRPAHLGRNMGQGPDFWTFDLRLSRRFALNERINLEAIAEGFNLANRTNFRTVNNVVGDVPYQTLGSPIVGNRQPASFPLAFTSALNPRQFQLGLKISY